MTAGQPQVVMLGPLDKPQPEDDTADVRFVLRRPCVQAYAMVATEAGRQIAFEKMTWDDNAWRLTLALKPGTYRYRYYVSDGASTAYFSPADADRVGRHPRMEGIDGLFDLAPDPPRPHHPPREPDPFVRSLRPGISSLPICCEGAFF
jgi:hypothetical protein